MQVRIATRKSELALWQARHVGERLAALDGVTGVTLVPLSTRGDEILDRSLQKIGGKGLFIKELEVAMRRGEADIAVHSMKDVPAEMPAGFCIAAVLPRANPRDAFVSRSVAAFSDLPHGARVGSSSLRRQAQLLAERPDIRVLPLRGNVNTRLRKLEEGEYDAIILACAGLERLGLSSSIREQFDTDRLLPAAAQGVIGIECMQDRLDLRRTLAELEDPRSAVTTRAERAVSTALEASCQSPVASYATTDAGRLRLTALVASPDGVRVIRETLEGDAGDAEALGTRVAELLLERGAADLLGGETA